MVLYGGAGVHKSRRGALKPEIRGQVRVQTRSKGPSFVMCHKPAGTRYQSRAVERLVREMRLTVFLLPEQPKGFACFRASDASVPGFPGYVHARSIPTSQILVVMRF